MLQISALRINVYIDCLLKDIRNASDEPVKSVHLLAVAVYISKGDQKEVLDHVIPALSSPFTVSKIYHQDKKFNLNAEWESSSDLYILTFFSSILPNTNSE